MAWPLLIKRELGPPNTEGPAPSYKMQKIFSPNQKKYLWVGVVYTMENKDTNTDYQKFVRVRYQK